MHFHVIDGLYKLSPPHESTWKRVEFLLLLYPRDDARGKRGFVLSIT